MFSYGIFLSSPIVFNFAHSKAMILSGCVKSFKWSKLILLTIAIARAVISYKFWMNILYCNFPWVVYDDVIKWKHFPRYWPLWGESTGHRWIPLTKASDAELWCFLWSSPARTVEQAIETPRVWYVIVLIMTSLCRLMRNIFEVIHGTRIESGNLALQSAFIFIIYKADYRFAPSQCETALLCNDVAHWLGASLDSALL